jgi:hypothetical protein
MKKSNTQVVSALGARPAKNSVKPLATISANQTEAQPIKKEVVVIAEGLTGKQMMALKIQANRLNREELRSFSFQVNQMKKHGQAFLKACKVSESELTPKNLLVLRTEREAERNDKGGFSFWLIESLVKRYSVAKLAK